MRNRPFVALLVMPLFVGLAVTAVGLGWGKGIEARAAVAASHDVLGALDSSASDPQGDIDPLRMLRPFPDSGRDVTVSGNTATVLVPIWLLGDPQSFQWVAAVLRPVQDIVTDFVPKGRAETWSGGLSEAVDMTNLAVSPFLDLTYVRVRSSGPSRIEFLWRCRGDIPSAEEDLAYMMILDTGYRIVLLPSSEEWIWFADRPGDLAFHWSFRPYEDILSAGVQQTSNGQITFEMTVAQDIPDVPPDEDGYPWFTWILDVDADEAPEGAEDRNVVVRWDPESNAWEGAVRGWNGQHYEDLQAAVTVARAASAVSATVEIEDLGLTGHFLWRAQTSITAGVDEELFFSLADYAPDADWVEEAAPEPSPTATVSPTAGPTSEPTATPTETATAPHRIYLPVITRGVAP